MIDYYKILGVDRKADTEEIKKAFRIKAKKYHPDVSTSKSATDDFIKVYEAYSILCNESTRKIYDKAYLKYIKNSSSEEIIYISEDLANEIKNARSRSMYAAKMSFEDFKVYLRIVLNNIPDLILTIIVLLTGLLLTFGVFTNNNAAVILGGVLIGIPLIIVSIRDLYLIFKINKMKKETSLNHN